MPTMISSRTWGGGEPRRCPICAALSWVEPTMTIGDAPCPRCGHLLWPGNRARRLLATVSRRHASTAYRLGRTVKRALAGLRSAVGAVKRAGTKQKTPAPAKSKGAVWDAWLDA